MNTKQTFFDLGTAIGAASYDIDYDELTRRKAAARVMESKAAAPFKRELCKIASAAFDTAEDYTSPAACLFRSLSKEAEWHVEYDKFTDSVLRALSKQAGALLPMAAATHDKMGGGIMKNLLGAGVLGGGALGSLAFLLSRNAEQSSAENAALLEKVKAYKQLKRDIEEDMEAGGVMEG